MIFPALVLVAACAGEPALASNARFTAAISGGSLGVGPEVGIRANDYVGARGDAGFLNIAHSFASDDLRYRGRVRLKSIGGMADLYPFGNGFRISAGARRNWNKGHISAMPSRNTSVGRMTYTPQQIGTIEGDAITKKWAPALTIGYAGKNRSGFVFGAEAGAFFQGRIRIGRFTNSTGMISAADLEEERTALQSDVNHYKVYPVLRLSAGYRF